jgi:peptide/nickel transport system ATP-binding protein
MGAVVEVSHLRVLARSAGGGEVPIVDDVSFRSSPAGARLIGESGSGKTTIALALMGYARTAAASRAASVKIGDADVLGPTPEQRGLRGRTVSYIAQSAAASFNPSRSIMDQSSKRRTSMD